MGRKRIPDAEKYCERCGKRYYRTLRPSGKHETHTAFAGRKYCSLSCANSKPVVKRQMKMHRARKHLQKQCEACGQKDRLHAHHVNGDHDNWSAENIQTLCTYCHGFWHWMLERRGLPIAHRMPALLPRYLMESRGASESSEGTATLSSRLSRQSS